MVAGTVLLNAMGVIAVPVHIVCDAGVAIAPGAGSTITVAGTAVPGQPLATGVMVNVTVSGNKVVFVNVPVILPLPLAAIPVTAPVLSLVQV